MDPKHIAFSPQTTLPPTTQPSTPQRPPAVAVEIANLRDSVDRLNTIIGALASRLGPISRQRLGGAETCRPEKPADQACEVASVIHVEVCRIMECVSELDTLMGSLEV